MPEILFIGLIKIAYFALSIFVLTIMVLFSANDHLKDMCSARFFDLVSFFVKKDSSKVKVKRFARRFADLINKLALPVVVLATITSIPLTNKELINIQHGLSDNFFSILLICESLVIVISVASLVRLKDSMRGLLTRYFAYCIMYLLTIIIVCILDIIIISSAIAPGINSFLIAKVHGTSLIVIILFPFMMLNFYIINAGLSSIIQTRGIIRMSLESVISVYLIVYIGWFNGHTIAEVLARVGFDRALVLLSQGYEYGYFGLPIDSHEAVRLFRIAADKGLSDAQYDLGVAYQNGQGDLPKDDKEAVRLYRLAADQGNVDAEVALSSAYQYQWGGLPKDNEEAMRLYKLAADKGNVTAQTRLGLAYENGWNGLIEDHKEAARLYKLAADQGNAGAQLRLGLFYQNGWGGLTKDEQEAVRLYKLAADQGNAEAQHNLGLAYQDGEGGLPRDEKEAVRLYKLAADQGNAEAQYDLAVSYENGEGGLPKDEKEAVRLYKLAADQGNDDAEVALGEMYEDGEGGLPINHKEAMRLYKLAADQHNTKSIEDIKQLTAKTNR